METDMRQMQIVPPETSLEYTLRTGKIDVFGLALDTEMSEMVAIFDDVIERPSHYYDEEKSQGGVASTLGGFIMRKAVRVLGEGTLDEIHENRSALGDSVVQHLDYTFNPHAKSITISDDNMYDIQRGLEQERAAYDLLMDSRKIPGSGYELNLLRSYDGLAGKMLCEIVDAPDQVMMSSELHARFPDQEKLRFILDTFVDLRVIRVDPFRSTNEQYDRVPPDTAYAAYPINDPYCRTNEDSELMVLARHHARRYDEQQNALGSQQESAEA